MVSMLSVWELLYEANSDTISNAAESANPPLLSALQRDSTFPECLRRGNKRF